LHGARRIDPASSGDLKRLMEAFPDGEMIKDKDTG